MYSESKLKSFPYSKYLDDFTLDIYTGVLSRSSINKYATNLIANKIPFLYVMIDLDNFKDINDNYGHLVGDETLAYVAKKIVNYVGDKAIVGRFGGDEFVFIYTDNMEYDVIHSFFEGMYSGNKSFFGKTINLKNVYPFITATIGCAKYPFDATSYESLFIKADKAMYRGKLKGRNCFIIYLDEKHKNIDLSKKVRPVLSFQFFTLKTLFDMNIPLTEKLLKALEYTKTVNQLFSVYFISIDGHVIDAYGHEDTISNEYLNQLKEKSSQEKIFCLESYNRITENLSNVEYLENNRVKSLMMTKVKKNDAVYGYLFFAENQIPRIWQEEDRCLLLHLSDLLAYEIYLEDLRK